MKWLVATLLLMVPVRQDDKAAEELLNASRKKIAEAKTIRIEFSLESTARGEVFEIFRGTIKAKGKDRWALEIHTG